MHIETAIKHIKKDAEFLGLSFTAMLEFIEKSPLAQTQKTLIAYRALKDSSYFA
jgi:hypothetical protein